MGLVPLNIEQEVIMCIDFVLADATNEHKEAVGEVAGVYACLPVVKTLSVGTRQGSGGVGGGIDEELSGTNGAFLGREGEEPEGGRGHILLSRRICGLFVNRRQNARL